MPRRPGPAGAFRLEITLGTGRAARNVASARLHPGDFPLAVPGHGAAGPPGATVGGPGQGVKRWPAGVVLAGGSGSGPPRAREDRPAAAEPVK